MVPIHTDSGGHVVVQESIAYPGTTCDGDYYYAGAVQDARDDGSCAYIYYLEVYQYYATQGYECTTYSWSVYSYTDIYGSNNVNMQLATIYNGTWYYNNGY
jgi:hypothetical protein